MAEPESVEMDEAALTEFLERSGTGVLSFATGADEPPYSIPVSYGYDERQGLLYFRLALSADSEKAARLEDPVSFVTYRQTDSGWQSAVATGVLEAVPESDYESSALQGLWSVEIPLVDVFEHPTREVAFRHFVLDPERLSGRKESRAAG